jgi:hypothetical protein
MRIFQTDYVLLLFFIVRTTPQPFNRAEIGCFTERWLGPPNRGGCVDAINEIREDPQIDITWPHFFTGQDCSIWIEPAAHIMGHQIVTSSHLINWSYVRSAATAVLNDCFPHGTLHTGGKVTVRALDRGNYGPGLLELEIAGTYIDERLDSSQESSRASSPSLPRDPSPALTREPRSSFRREPRSDLGREPSLDSTWRDLRASLGFRRKPGLGLLRDPAQSTRIRWRKPCLGPPRGPTQNRSIESIESSTTSSTRFSERSSSVILSQTSYHTGCVSQSRPSRCVG